MYNYLVFIGRFQPMHNGHLHVIQQALKETKKLIIVIGSANVARSERNPFTYEERKQMMMRTLVNHLERLIFVPSNDFLYSDDAWVAEIQKTVHDAVLKDMNGPGVALHGYRDAKIGLVGFSKDHSSYYLKKFPEWGSVDVKAQWSTFNSSDIRDDYLRSGWRLPSLEVVPDQIKLFLAKFAYTEDFKWLVDERRYNQNYNPASYNNHIVCCVDAVCVQSGHILLIERAGHPGKGLLALPGGHVDKSERFKTAAVRELKEETRISDRHGEMPPAKLASFIKESRLFDDPTRSLRARVISMAYLFKFPDSTELYQVRGDDDAKTAKWYKLGELSSEMFFEDHWHIIQTMIAASKD